MYKKAAELRLELSPNHKGGRGVCRVLNLLEPDEMHGTGRCFGISTIPPGGSIGTHAHIGDFETYYILKGSARFNDNGTIVELGPGDVAHCADGDFHGIENIGDCDLEYFAVIQYSEVHRER